MFFLLLGWLVLCVLVGVAADRRGRSGAGWCFLAIFISPFLAGAILAVLQIPGVPVHAGSTKMCPQCAEMVKAEAKICRFCRYEFPPDASPAPGVLPTGYQGQLEGFPYKFEGKHVITLTETGPVTFRNWAGFSTAVDRCQIKRAL
jgi:hypothetical protein